ncbi:DUF1097 domain-containing protein [Saccharothrix coeruleofusca]|uniref:DUF1097 domain-containing protein n=1 Tax=Saccharothrix coeruleofusca TaxID=33919 RepID=A0A918AQM6_9PSEU|nr:DUF1097 domain-containing protein [Saccharothrix coeruleofusca]GGP73870.1 hypothetical protein GCM10010185_54150 [Saccharothrix coeruleofusca]
MSQHAVTAHTTSRFVVFTVIAGAVAAVAAFAADSLSFPAWAMFVGWVAWFSRPTSPVQGAHAMVCLWLGLVLAASGQLLAGALAPVAGPAALPLAVFVLALVVVGLRTTPVLNNMLAWFLGLIAFYAAHSDEIGPALLTLGAATAIGAAAGFACQRLQRRFA